MKRVATLPALTLLLALAALVSACAAPAPRASVDPNAPIVQTYQVAGGGEIRVTVQPRYPGGRPIVLQLAVVAGAREVRGPVAARVLSSGIEGERLIRTLAPSSLGGQTVPPGARATVAVTWDGRTDAGDLAPKDTYTLTLDFVVGEDPLRVGSTIEITTP